MQVFRLVIAYNCTLSLRSLPFYNEGSQVSRFEYGLKRSFQWFLPSMELSSHTLYLAEASSPRLKGSYQQECIVYIKTVHKCKRTLDRTRVLVVGCVDSIRVSSSVGVDTG